MSCYNKYKLPCFNYIATGHCSYMDRCTFIHDPRLTSKFRSTIRRPTSGKYTVDSFHYPQCPNDSPYNHVKYFATPNDFNEDTSLTIYYGLTKNIKIFDQDLSKSKLSIWRN